MNTRQPSSEYKYLHIKHHSHQGYITTKFLTNIHILYPERLSGLINGTIPFFFNGEYTFEGITFFVVDQHKQGIQYLWFKSLDEYNTLCKLLQEKVDLLNPNKAFRIYRYNIRGGVYNQSGNLPQNVKLIGYDNYVSKICSDITLHIENTKFLDQLGESKSLNYLLKGDPGLGKTTLIINIARLMGMDVYIVNPSGISIDKFMEVFSPSTLRTHSLIIFEDFDRFLEELEVDSAFMSQILNCLNGLNDSKYAIRFFTGNNCKIIEDNSALISRMTRVFHFINATVEHYLEKLRYVIGQYEQFYDKHLNLSQEEMSRMTILANDKSLSLRTFSCILFNNIFKENFCEMFIKELEEYSNE